MVYKRCALCGYGCPTERTSGVYATCPQYLVTHLVQFGRQPAKAHAPSPHSPSRTTNL
jgi:hypothetical protein